MDGAMHLQGQGIETSQKERQEVSFLENVLTVHLSNIYVL